MLYYIILYYIVFYYITLYGYTKNIILILAILSINSSTNYILIIKSL